MIFGEKGIEQKHWSEVNLQIAISKMKEEAPMFGEGGNTGEREGKYFAMGFELRESEYQIFLDKFEKLSGEIITIKKDELKKVA